MAMGISLVWIVIAAIAVVAVVAGGIVVIANLRSKRDE